jgi:O-antigen/teichoic acid export membrane protein
MARRSDLTSPDAPPEARGATIPGRADSSAGPQGPAPERAGGHRLRDRLVASWRVHLFRSSYALILTTAINAAFGVLFWVAAARLLPTGVVGLGAGGVSALQLVASFGWVGLSFVLMRYVPVAGGRSGRLVAITYASGVAVALLAASVFVVVIAPQLRIHYLVESWATSLAFLGATVVWVVFSLQDSVLVGLRRATLVPIENGAFGALKLGLLLGFAGLTSPWTLFAVWVGAAAAVAVAVNILLYRRLLVPSRSHPSALPRRAAVARFAAGHHAVALLSAIPDYLVPLLILRLVGREESAYYYVAWTVGFSLRLVAVNMANAFLVEGAYAEGAIRQLLRRVRWLGAGIVLPLIALVVLAAEPILGIFGESYGDRGAALLRWFGVGLVPFTVVTFVIAVDRVREQFRTSLAGVAVATGTTIGLIFVLVPRYGITGAGVAWCVAQTLAAAVAVAEVVRRERAASRRAVASRA